MDTPPGAIPSLGEVAWAALAASGRMLFVSFINSLSLRHVVRTSFGGSCCLGFASLRQLLDRRRTNARARSTQCLCKQWSNGCRRSLFRCAFLIRHEDAFWGQLRPLGMSFSARFDMPPLMGDPGHLALRWINYCSPLALGQSKTIFDATACAVLATGAGAAAPVGRLRSV
jgi:hypothetical protein